MPHLEVLPTSSSSLAPGWTYVVDTGYDPSKIAINPKNKKRVAALPGGPRGEQELSSRQQAAIARRIAELNRDNDPKVIVGVPVGGKGGKLEFHILYKHESTINLSGWRARGSLTRKRK
jgi:hypothetical protein